MKRTTITMVPGGGLAAALERARLARARKLARAERGGDAATATCAADPAYIDMATLPAGSTLMRDVRATPGPDPAARHPHPSPAQPQPSPEVDP